MPRIKKATDASGAIFYPVSISKAVWDTDRNQRLSATVDSIATMQEGMLYRDLYVGVGGVYSDILTLSDFHEKLIKGTPLSFSPTAEKLWVIAPSAYTPTLLMEGFRVPMAQQASITLDGAAYKVYGSDNTYTGSFDIFLF